MRGFDASAVLEDQPDVPQDIASRLERSIQHAYKSFDQLIDRGIGHWMIMYSGGKDSTTTLLLALEYALLHPGRVKKIEVIFADTQVEIPTLYSYAIDFLNFLKTHPAKPVVHTIKPPTEKTFWALMIGRGYPAPHQKFRWCTDKLKIQPAEVIIKSITKESNISIITGVRFGESDVRDKRLNLSCSRGGECGQGMWFNHSERLNAMYAAPIASWRECDVWDYVNFIGPSLGYPTSELQDIYQGHNTRFGCWTCTVVKTDKTMKKITEKEDGKAFLPMFEFRNWLLEYSKDHKNRMLRPNGVPGRLSLDARKEIFLRLRQVEKDTGIHILSNEESLEINKCWDNPRYTTPYK